MLSVIRLQERFGSRCILFLGYESLKGLQLSAVAGIHGRPIAIAQVSRPVDSFGCSHDRRRDRRPRRHSNLATIRPGHRTFPRNRSVPIAN